VLREPARLPTQGLAPSPEAQRLLGMSSPGLRDLDAAWYSSGIPVPAGRVVAGRANAWGPAPASATAHSAKLGLQPSHFATPPHNTLTGIHSQAPASVSTALRQDPQLLPGRLTPQLFPKASRMRGQVRRHRGGRDEPLKLTQACLASPLRLRPQQSDRSHLLPSPSLPAVPAASSTPLTWRGCCKSFPLFSFSFTSKKKKKAKASRSH